MVLVLYAREDRAAILPLVDELALRGIETWIDQRNLRAGENWQESILAALNQAGLVLAFVSPNALASAAFTEQVSAAVRAGAPVVPALIAGADAGALPKGLRALSTLDIAAYPATLAAPDVAEAAATAIKLAESLNARFAALGLDKYEGYDRRGLARELAQQSRGFKRRATDVEDKAPPTSVFIVHGHDEAFLEDVAAFVSELGVKPIVMKDIGGASMSLVQKFLEMGRAAKYAIVLLSADDYGAARYQFEEAGVGERALRYRTRQNVVLELGFFYGYLGWENVFVLEKNPPKVFPNFERPSDLDGIVFDRYDASGRWRGELHRRLSSHGFQIPALTSAAK